MQPVIIAFLFFIHGHLVGAQLVGTAENQKSCESSAAAILESHKGQEPAVNGEKADPFPLCIDTTDLGAQIEKAKKDYAAKQAHGPSAKL